MRSYRYIRREQVLAFIGKHPGLTTKQVSSYFRSHVSGSLHKLLMEGKLMRVKVGCSRWYVKKDEG